MGVHPCSILIKTEDDGRTTDGRTVPFLQTMDYHSVGAAQGAHGAQRSSVPSFPTYLPSCGGPFCTVT